MTAQYDYFRQRHKKVPTYLKLFDTYERMFAAVLSGEVNVAARERAVQ